MERTREYTVGRLGTDYVVRDPDGQIVSTVSQTTVHARLGVHSRELAAAMRKGREALRPTLINMPLEV